MANTVPAAAPPGGERVRHGGAICASIDAFVIIGDTAAAHRVAGVLAESAAKVTHLAAPTDRGIRDALTDATRWVAITVHDDIGALRYALAGAHLAPEVSILVTVFDRTIGDELQRLLANCEVTSPADLALEPLVRMCLSRSPRQLVAITTADGQRGRQSCRRMRSLPTTAITHLTGFARITDSGARVMTVGLLGLAVIVILDFWWLLSGEHRQPTAALHEAVRVVTTVGPAGAPTAPAMPLYRRCRC